MNNPLLECEKRTLDAKNSLHYVCEQLTALNIYIYVKYSRLYVKNGVDNIGVLVYVVVKDVHALRYLQELRCRPHPISRLRVAQAHLSYLSTKGDRHRPWQNKKGRSVTSRKR